MAEGGRGKGKLCQEIREEAGGQQGTRGARGSGRGEKFKQGDAAHLSLCLSSLERLTSCFQAVRETSLIRRPSALETEAARNSAALQRPVPRDRGGKTGSVKAQMKRHGEGEAKWGEGA